MHTAYNQWTRFEDFPRFMEHVDEVRQLDDEHLLWRVTVARRTEEFDAKVTEQIPDTRISWKSTNGRRNAGAVDFHPLGDERCQVVVSMDAEPEGALERVADATGIAGRQVRADLGRFKAMIEARGSGSGGWRGSVEREGSSTVVCRAGGRRGAPPHVLERTQVVPVSPDRAFAFFSDPGNLEAITPPWLRFRIIEAPERLERGSRLHYRLRLSGLPIRWLSEIVTWLPPRSFTDVQLEGPYRLWEHTHRLMPIAGGTEIYDHVRYRLFLGPVGGLVQRLLVRGWVEGIFDYRARNVGGLIRAEPAAQPRRTA